MDFVKQVASIIKDEREGRKCVAKKPCDIFYKPSDKKKSEKCKCKKKPHMADAQPIVRRQPIKPKSFRDII